MFKHAAFGTLLAVAMTAPASRSALRSREAAARYVPATVSSGGLSESNQAVCRH